MIDNNAFKKTKLMIHNDIFEWMESLESYQDFYMTQPPLLMYSYR